MAYVEVHTRMRFSPVHEAKLQESIQASCKEKLNIPSPVVHLNIHDDSELPAATYMHAHISRDVDGTVAEEWADDLRNMWNELFVNDVSADDDEPEDRGLEHIVVFADVVSSSMA